MRSWNVNGDSRLCFWLRVREFAVPPSMIECATTRRALGDWAGACAAAHVDIDLNLRSAAHFYGRDLAAEVRADLRHLAPDLLRWHMPRIAPDGLLRPGLTISLARYHPAGQEGGNAVHLVARTSPTWADAGQRISLALWDGSRPTERPCPHPRPRPDRRFRLDLHRHLWDARRIGELPVRSGTDQQPAENRSASDLDVLRGRGCAVDQWDAEARVLLRAEGRASGTVAVRLGSRHRLVLDLAEDSDTRRTHELPIRAESTAGRGQALPMLPDAATWVLPDLALLRAGLIEAHQLHPLVAAALAPGYSPPNAPHIPDDRTSPRLVECRGTTHRIGLVNGVLVPLDHNPAEIRREELLAALTGTPLPCLQAIEEAHRRPRCLDDIRARLDHGDVAGALASVENLLGPGALLPGGALRDELEAAALRRVTYGLFRAGLLGRVAGPTTRRRPRGYRTRPRHSMTR